MLNDRDVPDLLRRANPVPDPDQLPELAVDALFSKTRRPTMSTPAPTDRPWYRKPLVAAASFVFVLAALGLLPIFVFGSVPNPFAGQNTPTTFAENTPTTFAENTPTTFAESTTTTVDATATTESGSTGLTPGAFVTYGTDQGLPEGCGSLVAAGSETIWVAGQCGLFRLEGDSFVLVDDLITEYGDGLTGTGSPVDLEVDQAGTVWIGSPDVGVRSYEGTTITSYDVRSPWLAAGLDGTIWAIPYNDETYGDETYGSEALLRFDGTEWTPVPAVDSASAVMVDSEGIVWVTGETLYSYDGEAWTDAAAVDPILEPSAAGRDGVWVFTVPPPRPCDAGPCEAIMLFDGRDWNDPVLLPTVEELGSAMTTDGEETIDNTLNVAAMIVASDGTVWIADQVYGAYYYDGIGWNVAPTGDVTDFTSASEGPDGSIWFGTMYEGLVRYLPEH